ncbi:MAG: hypothetical protein GC171_10355 [Terrimonas sp.]|nr:hypothetical protein [Terrimonas sp.]
MKKICQLFIFLSVFWFQVLAQNNNRYAIPEMPDPGAQKTVMEQDWLALQNTPPRINVRAGFMFLLDALNTHFLTAAQTEWLLKKLKTRVITDKTSEHYGNMYWGWTEVNNNVGDGNNVQFSVQYGIQIKILFNDRLSDQARKTLDEIFHLALNGVRNQTVRISYTNILIMKIWNLVALGQVYHDPAVIREGRALFDQWLQQIARYGNREYDSPTYCGVDLESLSLLHKYAADEDIRERAADALRFFLTDISAHYHARAGILGGAHSRDYNRVFSRDLLEEKYINPLLGGENHNDHLFHQVCFTALKEFGLTKEQKSLMQQSNRYIVQRWDSLPNTYASEYVGNKFSIASSNQAYSPDDKPFVIYLSSPAIPAMPNIAYVAEGRDDHYGTWSAEGKGEKMKALMPPNYPSNGGWNKTRHLSPFIQTAQNRNEFVMLVSGTKDHNCIYDYLNSTIILPNTFDEIWLGNQETPVPEINGKQELDTTQTFFARFEDVAIAIRLLWDNAATGVRPFLYNDGFAYHSARESFVLKDNKALRITLRHPDNGKLEMAMWWKVEEGIKTEDDFKKFRQSILETPVNISYQNGIADIAVITPAGKLGVKADLKNKKRLDYYNPAPVPQDLLFNIDGVDIGRAIMNKYR